MQFFGKFKTVHDLEYLTKSYLYIPLKDTTLPHFFSDSIIYQSKYMQNKIEDIQDVFKDYILISKSKWVKNCDSSIEIELSQKEKKSLYKLDNNFYLYNNPISFSKLDSVLKIVLPSFHL